MKRFLAVFIIGGLALLSACGGDTPTVITPPPSTALITPIGANIGTPVTQTIGAAGGVVTLGKVTVSAPSGAFNGSSLRLQAISDTYNDSGQGIAISSDASWNKYLTVTLPIDPSEDSPESLGLAVQQSDGSWRSLEPVRVDVAAGTVSAGLPAVTEVSTARVRAQGGLDLKRVIKFKKYYFKPPSATVKVGKTQTFVPYAQVLERPKGCAKPQPVDPNEELVPLIPIPCLKNLTREYPFTNDKDDFARLWMVNGILNGNSTVGTIDRSSGSGATYTAPDKKPSPDTVTVSFQSIQTDTLDSVSIKPPAKVKIIDDFLSSYAGSVAFSGSNATEMTYTGQGNLTWTIVEDLPNDLAKYEATGSMQVTTTIPGCSAVSASVPVMGTMIVFDPVRGGAGDLFATKYWFALNPAGGGVTVTGQCGQPPKPTPLPVTFQVLTACPENPTLPDASKHSNLSKLTNSGTWACSFISTTANWDLEGK